MGLRDSKKAKSSSGSKTTTINNIKLTKSGSIMDKIPKGSTILEENVNISIEQIENGFITTKSFDYKYQAPEKEYTDWAYHTMKFFTEEMPVNLTVPDGEDSKSLVDIFDV